MYSYNYAPKLRAFRSLVTNRDNQGKLKRDVTAYLSTSLFSKNVNCFYGIKK